VPGLATDLDPAIVQLTAATYRRPDHLPPGPVLVVGAGNSGAEIATDIARRGDGDRRVLLAGRDVGRIPPLGAPVFRAMRRIRTRTGPGRLIRHAALGSGGDPLGSVDPRQFPELGITRLPRINGTEAGLPVTDDGDSVAVHTIIWCTGADPDRRWLTATDEQPVGVAGLHHLGMPYQRTLASHLLGGVGLDARALVRHLERDNADGAPPGHLEARTNYWRRDAASPPASQ